MPDIHTTAIISDEAVIGENVKIGPYSIIEGPVKIGSGTSIGPHALITGDTTLGENCTVHSGAVVGVIPQDLKFENEESKVLIGNNVTLREYVTVNRGTHESGSSSIGNNCLLMAYAHVAHDCHIGDNVIMANAVNLAGHVLLQDYAIVGGLVAVHQFVSVGAHSIIGGGFRVTKDICPYTMAAGYPISVRTINWTGLKRRNFSAEAISNIKSAFNILFRSPYNTSDAVKKITEELPDTEEIQTILKFIASSRRGLVKKC